MKSPGQIAYENNVKQHPTYHDGTPRKPWGELDDAVKRTWIKNSIQRGTNE